MSHIVVTSERVIDAKPTETFQALADYATKRPRMLPPNYSDYTVKKGGHGGGTVISYLFRAAGRERPYEMHVEETINGQLLTERDKDSSLVTRWSVMPLRAGEQSKVKVETDWEGGKGVGGFFERTFAPLGLRKIYNNALISLALMVQPPTQNQELLKSTEKSPAAALGLIAASLGAVVAVVVGIRYFRNREA